MTGAPGRQRFAHALLRDTLYLDLPVSERARLHASAGRALEDLYGADLTPHLTELAQHFLAGAEQVGADTALRYAAAAARRATELRAYEEAARLYEQALASLDLGSSERGERDRATQRVELLLALADARSMASDDARARASYFGVAELADRLGLAEPLARAALWAGGRGDMAGLPDPRLIALLERALAALGPRDSARRSQLLSRLSGALTLVPGTLERRMQLCDAAEKAAEVAGDADSLGLALVARQLALCGPGGLDERLALGERLLSLARARGSRESLAMALLWHAKTLLETGEIQRADEAMQEFAALANELAQRSYQVHVAGWRAMRATFEGRLSEAESLVAAMLAAGAHADPMNTPLRYASQMYGLRREQGRLGEMAPGLLDIVASLPALPSMRAGTTLAALEAGRAGEARAQFEIPGSSVAPGLPSGFSNLGSDLFATGQNVPTLNGGRTAGTSFSAPQIAGLVSYLWLVSPDLRAKPVASTIASILANVNPSTKQLDAYASVLSLDEAVAVTPATAKIRLAILDVDPPPPSSPPRNPPPRVFAFNEDDLQEFHDHYVSGGVPVAGSRDFSRLDLNGDGFTGGPTSARFDLDPTGSLRFGAATYGRSPCRSPEPRRASTRIRSRTPTWCASTGTAASTRVIRRSETRYSPISAAAQAPPSPARSRSRRA